MASNIGMSGFSGYDTAAMVEALVATQKANLNRLQAAKSKATVAGTAWDNIAARVRALSSSALQMSSPGSLVTNSVSSSDSKKVAVSGNPKSPVTLEMSVSSLATSALWRVSGLASTASSVGAGTITVVSGGQTLGASLTVSSNSGHKVEVTQASAAASVTSSPVALSIQDPASLIVEYASPTGTQTLTASVPQGTYASTEALAVAVQQALGSPDVAVTASGSSLVFTTTAEGSAHSLSFSGPLAQSWGLSAATAAGVDAVVSVDGTATTLTSLSSGAAVTAGSPSGTVTFTIGSEGGLRRSSAEVFARTFTSESSVSDVVTALSAAGSPVYATAVGGQGNVEVMLAGRSSGVSGDISVNWSGFDVGTAQRVRSAEDAVVSLGGATFSRSSNAISDLIPGVTLSLLGTTTEAVTITGTRDTSGLVSRARSFINQVNDVLSAIDTATKSNTADYTLSGPLASDSTAKSLRRSVVSVLNQQVGSGPYSSLTGIGISVDRSGIFSLDETRLKAALEADPDAVERVLSQGGTAADARVSFTAATAATQPGSYAVELSAAATKASVTGSVFTSLPSSETITVTVGSLSATLTASTGQSPAEVSASIQSALLAAGITTVVAEATSSGAVRLSAVGFGSSTSVSVTSTGTATGLSGLSSTGTDAAGTINGEAATGVGRVLTSSSGASAGLSVSVTATATEVAAAGGALSLGPIQFSRGISGLMRSTLESALASSGTVAVGKDSAVRRAASIDAQVERENRRVAAYELRLQKQFSLLETTLSRLRSSVPQWPTTTGTSG